MDFNEQAAIDFIRTRLSEESNAEYSDDEILNVIDMIWDYYEQNGLLDVDLEDDDDELDVSDLTAYVSRLVAKDHSSPIKAADIEAIVNAELDYEDSINEF